jgi:hypothetical protein
LPLWALLSHVKPSNMLASDSKITIWVIGLPCITCDINWTTDGLALKLCQIQADTVKHGTYIQFFLEFGQMVLENTYDFSMCGLSA